MPLITPEDYRPHAEKHEGRIPWMYLDSVGVVTIGIGHALRIVENAYEVFSLSGATEADVRRQYTAIRGQPKGKAAKFYARFSTLRLSDDEINELFARDCGEKIREARRAFAPGFANFPAPAQLALLDMIFNLGFTGLTTEWPRLMAAVREGDWQVCAAECNRPQLSADRNAWTHGQFMQAAVVAADPLVTVNDPPHGSPSGPHGLWPVGQQSPASKSYLRIKGGNGPDVVVALKDGYADGVVDPAKAPPKPLTHSRTMIGGVLTSIASAAMLAKELLSDWGPLIASYGIPLAVVGLLAGALIMYARWDDRKTKGH